MVRKVGTARRSLVSGSGRTWEAEICLHSGTGPQSPRLMVIFRDPTRAQGDRYILLPPDMPKMPKAAAEALGDGELARLLMRSVPLETF